MINDTLLRKYGLFDAKVPRYTSYPPATRFEPETGARHQPDWLDAVRDGEEISLYIHIPFCRRLCWFCACRTQGTQTLSPVEAYVGTLLAEVAAVRARLPERLRMARLHLGGGTPTILSGDLMDRLLRGVFSAFPASPAFEFSVEIDPTDAAQDVVETLARFGMTRASIGVQDFDPYVQDAIGRAQSYAQTAEIVDQIRAHGVSSVNVDLLYGLPHQTPARLSATLEKVLDLAPDRIALFGYAHVPSMSKRQVMIPDMALPGPEARYALSTLAQSALLSEGYQALGIDHFATANDSLARARANRTMRRNFQGYTDDPCATLIGLGASAISQFREGYVQNAVATAAYRSRIAETGLAGAKGYQLSREDKEIATAVQDLMCYGALSVSSPEDAKRIAKVQAHFPDCVVQHGSGLALRPEAWPLVRVIAAALASEELQANRYSLAV